MPGKVKPIPEGFHTLTPHLVIRDAKRAIDFYKRAFGAQPLGPAHLTPDGKVMHATLKIGDSVLSGPDAEARLGNCMPLENIPTGTQIHGVELQPGRGAQLVRSAGGVAQLVAKEGEYAQVRLPSGTIRIIHISCRATNDL